MEVKKPVVLIVLDGWGIAHPGRGNAISMARLPNYNNYVSTYPTMTLQASGEAVGLPWGQFGNSEVGHSSLGCGRVVYQDLPYINKQISNGEFYKNKSFLRVAEQVKDHNSQLHLIGLVSNGGVHSSINHLFALLEFCKKQKVDKVYIHAILDGRDTPKNSGLNFISKLEDKMKELNVGEIATISGRYWAMDRNNNWDRTEKSYMSIFEGKADVKSKSPIECITEYYNKNEFDEKIQPAVITNIEGDPRCVVKEYDAFIFFNYRSERARQMSKAIILPSFMKFKRPREIPGLTLVSFTEYERDLPIVTAFRPEEIKFSVSRIVSEAGLKQYHIAETEKYAHVTFFFDGGQEEPFEGEDKKIIPSPAVSSYDEKPAMSAKEIKVEVLKELTAKKYDFMIINFANPDMVGHTGNIAAAIEAVEIVDKNLGEIIQTILALDGTAIITADHGNCDEMIDIQTGEINKQHSTNPVPCIFIRKDYIKAKSLYPRVINNDLSKITPSGILSDVAPTILEFLGLTPPENWTSRSLIKK